MIAAPPAAIAANPFADAQGRLRHIVELVEDNSGKPGFFPDNAAAIAWTKANSARRIDEVAKFRDIRLVATTSLIGTGFIAYLSEKDAEHLAKDPRVSRVVPDREIAVSALWSDIQQGAQVRPWGLQAMGIGAGQSNGTATVYVLDTGMELHADLPGLSAGDRLTALGVDANGQALLPNGCYSHATHVGGIIGAADNGSGVVGVLPGVRLVSIAIGTFNNNTCAPFYGASTGSDGFSEAAVYYGLELIYNRVLMSQQVGIVNMSMNDLNVYASNGVLGTKMRVVSEPRLDLGYKGALVVQSAGNQGGDACQFAYDAVSNTDGILVVGGLDMNGQRVQSINGFPGYYTKFGVLGGLDVVSHAPSSNIGPCVELWAPSQRILSKWHGGGSRVLSGTSMAAPHVAGLAARLLEGDNTITTSVQLEAAVRNHMLTLQGSNLDLPGYASSGQTANPTVEIVFGPLTEQNYDNRSTLELGYFEKFPEELTSNGLRFSSVGASYCNVKANRNGVGYLNYYTGSAADLAAGQPSGSYVWTVTCYSPQGTYTVAQASGRIRRHVTLGWEANTQGTEAGWQPVANGGLVYWGMNDPFDQRYYSYDADACRVETFGFNGPIYFDPDHPQRQSPVSPPYYGQTFMWQSDQSVNWPTNYTFARFYFGNPMNSPYGFAPFEGCKWKLTCEAFGDETKFAVMYGTVLR